MRAIERREYGGPEALAIEDLPIPHPEPGWVRIRVQASSLNPFEWHHMRGLPYLMRPEAGWRAPKNRGLGVDVAGVIDAVGDGVGGFAVGDNVFGSAHNALAEFATAKAENITRLPEDVAPAAAAAVPLAALTALQAIRDAGRMTPGARVLVLGASGGVGHFAVQIAKILEARRVVASCSARNAGWVGQLGADRVLDYARGDVERIDEKFDLILDLAGGTSIAYLRSLLAEGGSLVLVGGPGEGRLLGPAARIFAGMIGSSFRSERVAMANVSWSGADLEFLAPFLSDGRLRPVIHREVDLESVPVALAEVEEGHVPGKVVVIL
ncbi:NAD(P)-dependent alcohol dehydrogenase [Microbacterium sediminicola]|uniref:NAD(P)-dependent alcohol dehydrogenase n=1 Tax=Microbacterium sediminicola TaxID=415210 RepID=UPI0031D0FC66